ncbi:MAG: DMT family transporter [Elusimicrobium sp.]|jgi:drug/metabolite transporter (DMT)-like permease|nr:DMT family transporter [Elusimicrobium sp.]
MTYFYFFALAFCWGSAFLAAKNIVAGVDPLYGAFSRVFFGFLFFIILFALRRKSVKIPAKEIWKPWFLSSVLIILPFFLMFWGQQFVPSGVGGIFNGTAPIWTFIAGAIILKGEDSFTWPRALGVLIGIAGILCIMLPAANFQGSMAEFYGCLALVGMAICYALGNVFTKYIMVDHSTISTEGNIFHQYLFAFIVMGAVSLVFGVMPSKNMLDTKTVLSMIYGGVFSSAIAFLLLLALIKRLGALRAASVTYLVPIVALVLDFLATGRVPGLNEFAGIFLIFVSLFIIQKPVKK